MKIKFLGATHQVTGSSYLLEAAGMKILVDCGMFQERDYSYRNWEAFPVRPNQIQYVLLTHVHQDHSGLIPKLVKEGFTGEILLTPASKELFPIVILDSARIQEEDSVCGIRGGGAMRPPHFGQAHQGARPGHHGDGL